MCGIAGYVDLSGAPASTRLVQRMTDAIIHRGPDGEGVFVSGAAALGHRRLSIIDLTDAARQPMQTADGRYTIVYNGEVYNFQELRVALQARAVVFHSQGDSEVVLQAIAHWGEDALLKFNGMFAFAIWDSKERTLLLARDRFGVKPLYVAHAGDVFAFGSEIKAILAHPDFNARMDLGALREYLTFQNLFGERTLFAGVRILPPGTFLKIKQGKPAPEPKRYHEIIFSEVEDNRSADDIAHELNDLFRQAVQRQLVADVDVGAYLSGGMDSGSIVAVAAKNLEHLRTFTCGFDTSSASGLELYFDERKDAEAMSAAFGTEHYEMVLKAGDMERVMPSLVRHLEEPRVGQCYPNFFVARLASKFNKVVLSGAGGDELFGGYPWRYLPSVDADPAKLADNVFATWQRILPDAQAEAIYAPIWSDVRNARPRDAFDAMMPKPTGADPAAAINAILTFESRTFLHGLLVVADKIAMAHGLEERVPFLDNDLLDFAMRTPVRHKISDFENAGGGGEGRTTKGKRILRRALAHTLPPSIAEREKQGFSAPDASWFRGQSMDYVRRRIGQRSANIYNFLDYGVVHGLVEEHMTGQVNRRLMIWSLLYLEEMCDQFRLA